MYFERHRNTRLLFVFFASSWCRGLAAACDCGALGTVHLIFCWFNTIRGKSQYPILECGLPTKIPTYDLSGKLRCVSSSIAIRHFSSATVATLYKRRDLKNKTYCLLQENMAKSAVYVIMSLCINKMVFIILFCRRFYLNVFLTAQQPVMHKTDINCCGTSNASFYFSK